MATDTARDPNERTNQPPSTTLAEPRAITPDSSEYEKDYNPEAESDMCSLSSSISLTSSVTDYPMENGRRYHRYHEGTYLYPNDEPELDRLDMQYELIRLINGGRIFFAPLTKPERILDVGTGSGIWPIEMAEIFPDVEIIGTDLSPVQPGQVPDNVQFYVDDASESDWLWPKNHFDYIRSSMMLGALDSYPSLISTAFGYIKPGGYLECHEWDISCHCDDDTLPAPRGDFKGSYAFQNWLQYCRLSTSRLARPVFVAQQISSWMRDAGYVDIQERVTKVPLNPWPKDPHLKRLGAWSERNWLDGIAAFSYAPFGPRGLGWTQDEIEVFLVDVRKSIQDRKVHVYQNFHVVTGRKPLD
ncbi:hypothetical protein FQN49_007339 [Arthroderma sp. PD_2]|nr:hypothetical protein FQN49_007339 [Arthroderma sp. PD_2]